MHITCVLEPSFTHMATQLQINATSLLLNTISIQNN
jgi:hypothetical protein